MFNIFLLPLLASLDNVLLQQSKTHSLESFSSDEEFWPLGGEVVIRFGFVRNYFAHLLQFIGFIPKDLGDTSTHLLLRPHFSQHAFTIQHIYSLQTAVHPKSLNV